jgi:ComF family protein
MKINPLHYLFCIMYPNLCVVCGENLQKHEQLLCLICLHTLPKTNYHLEIGNNIEKRFWGKVELYRATAFFHFQKGSPFQKILHSLKYKDNKELGWLMGKYAAVDLLESADFKSIDLIIPVPLHPNKLKQRGYNQSEWIAKGISDIMCRPQDTKTLIRIKENKTQTRKSVFERFENTEGIFKITETADIEGKHILLIDDVLTTGSTLEACIKALLEIKGVRVSVFALAVA